MARPGPQGLAAERELARQTKSPKRTSAERQQLFAFANRQKHQTDQHDEKRNRAHDGSPKEIAFTQLSEWHRAS